MGCRNSPHADCANGSVCPRRTVVVVDTLKPIIGLEYDGKFLHQTKAEDTTAHVSYHYFSLMAEASTGNSAYVLGAVVSAISGLALFSYATQQRSTPAVADLV